MLYKFKSDLENKTIFEVMKKRIKVISNVNQKPHVAYLEIGRLAKTKLFHFALRSC